MKFSANELKELQNRGVSIEKVEQQLDNFHKGFPYLPIAKAAVVGNGILRLESEQADELSLKWDATLSNKGLTIEKFVPASGAATRMFKDYFEYADNDKMSEAVEKALENITKFAFYDQLVELGVDVNTPKATIDAIIRDGLNYGSKPKALIKFHKYSTGSRTACEEHLVEGALYGVSNDGKVKIHFTVSPEHKAGFEEVIASNLSKYESRYGVVYDITYSEQKSSTDTIAVDMNNEPFKTSDGKLLFRPAGHGALIENLNDIYADVVFVKTVDNVVTDQRKSDTVLYKKALASLALNLQSRIFSYLRAADQGSIDIKEACEFIELNLGYRFANGVCTLEELLSVLNRPIRVCGMVRNEGEPGGGPFWVKEPNGAMSVQIAESSQIAPEQKSLMSDATHFNPVDIICLPKDYKGKKFDLTTFVDYSTGFISQKSFAGSELKAQELPGLWNGAMANWNTLFVEVPITTFAPVKVLTDLLRIDHQ